MSAPAQPPAEGTEGAAPGGGPPGPPPNMTSNRRLQQTQAQVEEVVDIMRVNVDKVLERDQKLSELDDRADALQAGASQFESSAAKLKRKYWWKNCKMMIMLGAICAIIVVVIVRRDRRAGSKQSVYPPSGAPGRPPLSSRLLLALVQGSPLEKNHTTVLAVAQAWSKSALLAPQPYPPMGSIFWVSIPLRLTRCSWVYVLGGGC
ncbi:vesicle-associated membrane protein 1 isoform X1 [Ochotona curzoniae]|uniref:vesicle-associated membrane protein 1 isoform X1 n=1 Tax=Ochotona curzoniae TaxID=130825 RepID=UPI001B34BE5E|nr:vesicle-associated membrane protein 1 isoform X1 [Ochotona curzoniae]